MLIVIRYAGYADTDLERYRLVEVHPYAAVVGVERPPDAPEGRPERLHLFGHAELLAHEVAVHQPVVVDRHWHKQRVVDGAVEVSVHYYREDARCEKKNKLNTDRALSIYSSTYEGWIQTEVVENLILYNIVNKYK